MSEMKYDKDKSSLNLLSPEAVKAGAQLLEMKFVVPSIFECLRQFPRLLDEQGYKKLEGLVLKLKVDFKKEFDSNNEGFMTKLIKFVTFSQGSQEINIPLRDSPGYLRNILDITGNMKVCHMRIFKVISKCPDVIKFLEAYTQDDRFDKVMAIVRGQLSGYQFGLSILNSLIDSRRTLRPFLGNHNKTIKELSGEIIAALGEGDDISVKLNNIKNANEHLCEIKLWFARAGTTEISIDTVLPFINEVVRYGFYKIEMGLSEDSEEPVASLNIRNWKNGGCREVPASQIADLTHAMHVFVAKNEMSKGVSSDFDTFYNTTQIVGDLLCVYSELRRLGHPHYQRLSVEMNSVGHYEEDLYANALEEARAERNAWSRALTEHQNREPRLLFLSNMQILQCGTAISETYRGIHRSGTKEDIKDVFQKLYPYAWACFPESAAAAAGAAMDITAISAPVFTAYRVATRALDANDLESETVAAEHHLESVFAFISSMRNSLIDKEDTDKSSAEEEEEEEGSSDEDENAKKVRVVQAIGFTPDNLLYMLIEVFGDTAPHPSRTLYCERKTSTAEVQRFLACVEAFPALSYAVVGVNDLSVEPREVLLEWTAQALRPSSNRRKKKMSGGALSLVFTGRESLELFGFVPCKGAEDVLDAAEYRSYSGSGVDFKRARERLGVETLAVYTGKPQTGKSYTIAKRVMKHQCPQLGLSVSEDFSPATFIRRYAAAAAKAEEGKDARRALHISIKVSPYGRVEAFGRFLCDVLLWGVLSDRRTGEMRSLCGRGLIALHVYVEVEEAPADDAEAQYSSAETIIAALPGLAALSTEWVRMSESGKSYVFGFLNSNAWKQYSLAARCYAEYHSEGDGNGSSSSSGGGMKSARKALETLRRQQRVTTTELSTFRKHLLGMTGSIAVEKRLARLYCARYKWLLEHLEFLARVGALDGPSQGLVSPAVYCEIIENEVAQLSARTIVSPTQHLNIYSEGAGTYVDFSAAGQGLQDIKRRWGAGARRAATALPQTITREEALRDPAALRSALSSGFSDRSVCDILLAQGYVLTPDFVLKLLLLNDFCRARQNVVLSGDTGSGKTELLTVFSRLANLRQSVAPGLLVQLGAALREFSGLARIALPAKGACEDELFETAHLLAEAVQLTYASSDAATREALLSVLASFAKAHEDVIEETPSMRTVARKANMSANDEGNSSSGSSRSSYGYGEGEENMQDVARNAVLDIVQPRLKGTFVKILMHQGVTAEAFRRKVAEVCATAEALTRVSDEATVVVFIDECTSTTIMSLVKEVIADHTLDGDVLPSNIMWIGAFNRNEVRSKASKAARTETGTGTGLMEEDFAVRPPPGAFDYAEIVFNTSEDPAQQETFLRNLLLLRQEQGAFRGFYAEQRQPGARVKELEDICSTVLYCHRYIERLRADKIKGSGSTGGDSEMDVAVLRRTHMSLRDLVQCVDLYVYFHKHPEFFVRDMTASTSSVERRRQWLHYNALVLATAVAYFYRLPAAYRGEFERRYPIRAIGGPWRAYGGLVAEAARQLYADTEVPSGVAPTAALLENLLCTVVCIDARVPLVIVGPPGCSKTLSFKIAVDNMKGAQSAHAAYRGLGHAHPFRYQCSPASMDAEVAGVFRSAAAEQRMHDANPDQGRQRCVVLLDEAGLPDERRSPLKVLHYALDHPQVSAVLLSNTPLDAAKTSRMAMVVQSRPGAADLRELAWGSICGCDASGNVRREAALGAIPYAEAERIKGAVEALCAAYEELTGSGSSGESKGEGWAKYAPVPDYFHLRDFVYMLRYIGREHRKMERFYGFTPAIIARALRRNFGGAASEAQFKAVLGLFFERLRQCLRRFDSPAGNGIDWSCPPGCVRKLRATTLDALRESIVDEHVADGEDPNTAPFRNALVLDPTESEASVALLFGLGLCSTESTVVVHVSDFEQDATEEARSRAVVQVKDAMAEGKTVILLNAMAISTSFYDVFNKNFDMVPVNSSSSSSAESNSSENRNDDRKKEAGKTHSGDLTELYKRYRYFANVAVGSYSRPCSVHPDFRVIAHVPLSELPHVPPAFLSRFEKYCLSLESALDAVRPSLAPAQQAALARLQADSEKMIAAARPDAFYGLVPGETLNSICLQAALTMKASSATATAATTTGAGGPVTVPLQEPFHVSEEMAVQDAQAGSPDGRPKAARMANFLLLQLGRPEGILGCDVFPDAYLREYVVRQEHFSVLRLLRHLLAPCNLATRPRKLCLFTRSCAELVQLYCDRALQAFVTAMAASGPLSPSTDTNNGGGGGMTFVSLAQFPSSKACEDCVERFKHSGNSALICIADVRECTNDQINFFRKKVDAHVPYDSASGCSKAVVLILHYPPEMQPLLHTARSSTSAIFLNGWQFAYVDSFGCSSNNSNSNSNTGGVSYVGQDAESTYDASSLSLSLLKSQEGEESNEERDSERDDGGSSGNGTSEERVELLLNPRMWLVRAFNLDVECSADDVRSLFAKMFADKVHAQVCNIQRSITQGKKPRLPLSGKFYRGSAKNGSGRPSAKVMARFLDDVLGAQSYIVDAVLAKFTAMWCGDLLHALVLEACRQISQGRILSGLLSVLQGALGTLLDPVVVLLLKAMCSNYALEPIARITLPDRAPEEAAAERAFVERILCNIGVPPKDVLVSMSLPAPGTAATTAATLTAKIHCLWPFPPYLPMFEVVLNRINELIAFIKIDGRAKPPCPYPALADELALRIRADWIGKAAKILKTSPHLLTLLKRDIVVFESRLYKVHVPQDVLDKDPAAGTLLDLCTDALEALTEGHKDSLAHLFLAADMKRQQLAFFVESVAKLQHIYPPVDMAALRGIFDFAALERNEPSPIENAVLRVGINGMWDSLCGACRGSSSGSNNEDSEAMLVSFEKTYRLVLAQMPSRKDLYAAGCIDTDALQLRADGVRLAELFLINVSPFKDEALPHLKVLVDLLGRRKESGPLSLKEAVEAAAAMAGDGVNAGPAAAFVRDVAHEFTECTKVPEEIPDSTRCDMSYFFSLLSDEAFGPTFPAFWAVNFLHAWVKDKPVPWKKTVLCDMLQLLPSKRSHSSVDLLKTDLTFFTPPEFVYYHMCVSVLSEGSVESALEYAAKSEGSDVIGLAACTAVIAKVVASTASNSGLNAVMRMNPAALALLKRLCSAGTNVENVSKFLITSFVSEEKCLAFLQNKDVLALLGMESLYIPTSSTSHMTHPLFTVLTSHPLYPDYMFFANGMTSDNNSAFVASLEKRVQDTSDNKPRFKRICKMMLLASLYYNFFNENKPSSLIQEYMPALSNIIGITPAEESVYRLVSNGWYDVPDQELDSFLALFSRQFRTAKDSDVTVAHYIMNVLIYTIGSPPESMFTYYRMFDIDKIFGTKCPGSAYHNNNVDCGFQAMVRPGVVLSPARIMGDVLQYRLALNSIIWTSFAWAFTATPKKAVAYVKRDQKNCPCSNLMTYGEDQRQYSGGRRNDYNTFKQYAYDRSTMFYGMFSLCSDTVTRNITPGHFMCEVLDTLWSAVDAGNDSGFVGICSTGEDAIGIESRMRRIFDCVTSNYTQRKNAVQEACSKYLKDSAYVIKFRQSRTAFLPTPVVSWQVIDSWMTAQTGEVQAINAVAAYLCTKDQEIAGLSQVPVLVSFYLRLHSELGCRVSKADLGLPVRDVLKKYDRDGALRADWEQFKTAWAAVVESIHQEGCASGMGERGFEFQSAAINDETLFLALISDPKNEDNPEGEIFKMIKLGVANVQERVLEKLTTSYEKLNPNDMLFDSENKSDFIAAALNKNTPNNLALLDVRGIDYTRGCAAMLVECDDTLSYASLSVNVPRFVIEMIRKTASGAVPMNKNESLREFLLCDFKAVEQADVERAAESRVSEQELVRSVAAEMADHLAEGGASMLRARLVVFVHPQYNERLDPGWLEAELRGAGEGLLNSVSGVLVSLIDFVTAVERHELEDDSDVIPEGLEHLERDTVEVAYEKAFGKKIALAGVRQKIGPLGMRHLGGIGAVVLRKLETHDWLFENERREYSVPLPQDVVLELAEAKAAVLSVAAAAASQQNASALCDVVEEAIRALSDRRRLRQSTPLAKLYSEKQAFRSDVARRLLPASVQSSYYVDYMKWLYSLLCELRAASSSSVATSRTPAKSQPSWL